MVGSAAPRQLTRGGKQHRTACATCSACITCPTVTLKLLSKSDTAYSQDVSNPQGCPIQCNEIVNSTIIAQPEGNSFEQAL